MRYPNLGPEGPPTEPTNREPAPALSSNHRRPVLSAPRTALIPSVSLSCEIVPLLGGFSDILVNWSEFWPAVRVSMPRIMISNRCKYIVRRVLHLIVWILAANSAAPGAVSRFTVLNAAASFGSWSSTTFRTFVYSITSCWFGIGWDSRSIILN